MSEHVCQGHDHESPVGSPEWTAKRKAYMADVTERLKTYDLVLQGVFDPQGEEDAWLYTIGMTQRGLPELIMGSFSIEDMGEVVQAIASNVTSADFERGYITPPGSEVEGRVALREVDPFNEICPLTTALSVYEGTIEGSVRAFQILIPCCHNPEHDMVECDRIGHEFPWEHQCTEFPVLPQ